MNFKLTTRSLENLINSPYPHTQMDIFYRKQIALQVFRLIDVAEWDYKPIPDLKKKGILINLAFNKDKKNNEKNYNRFLSSPFYNKFTLAKEDWATCFYHQIESPFENKVVAPFIEDILKEVYKPSWFRPVDIAVRAF